MIDKIWNSLPHEGRKSDSKSTEPHPAQTEISVVFVENSQFLKRGDSIIL